MTFARQSTDIQGQNTKPSTTQHLGFDPRLFPDIRHHKTIYTRFAVDSRDHAILCDIPLIEWFFRLSDTHEDKTGASSCFLLLGEGAIGKSTSLKLLEAELLMCGRAVRLIECKYINDQTGPVLMAEFNDLPRDTVYLLDGWDELTDLTRYAALALVRGLITRVSSDTRAKLIVTSRYNPSDPDEQRTRTYSNRSASGQETELFFSFESLFVQNFTPAQIETIVPATAKNREELVSLLGNTLYMDLYLRLRNRRSAASLAHIRNAGQLILTYFHTLLCDKQGETTLEETERKLTRIGKRVYEGYSHSYTNTEPLDLLHDLPALNSIVVEVDRFGYSQYLQTHGKYYYYLRFTHSRYEAFFLGLYLKNKFLSFTNMTVRRQWLASGAKHTKGFCGFDYLPWSWAEAPVFAGELMFTPEQKDVVRRMIDYSKPKPYTNILLYMLLGANHRCFHDTVFGIDTAAGRRFYRKNRSEYLSYLFPFFKANPYVTAIHLDTFDVFSWDQRHYIFPNLRKVSVGENHPKWKSKKNSIFREQSYSFLQKIEDYCVFRGSGMTNKEAKAAVRAYPRSTCTYLLCSLNEQGEIPPQVTHIGYAALEGNPSPSLKIGDSVDTVSFASLRQCPNLTRLYISAHVRGIEAPFWHSPPDLAVLEVDPTNPRYHSRDNSIIETAKKRLVRGCRTSVIPSDGCVTAIGAYAFHRCENLRDICLPPTVEIIERFAFSDCKMLASVRLPASLQQIDEKAFNSCPHLNEIFFDGTRKQWEAIHKSERWSDGLNNYIFRFSDEMEVVDSHTKPYTSDMIVYRQPYSSTHTPSNCSDGIRAIKDLDEMARKQERDRIRIHKSLHRFDRFINRDFAIFRLKKSYFDQSLLKDSTPPRFRRFGGCLIETQSQTLVRGYAKSRISQDGCITRIGEKAFANCSLFDIRIPEGVTHIDRHAFAGNIGLCLSLPSTLLQIGEGAFLDNPIKSLRLPNQLTGIGDLAFSGVAINCVTIPKTVLSIGDQAFAECEELVEVSLSDGLLHIGSYAFLHCPLKHITIPASIRSMGDSPFESGVIIHYNGTREEWLHLERSANDRRMCYPKNTVYCTDGVLVDWMEVEEPPLLANIKSILDIDSSNTDVSTFFE